MKRGIIILLSVCAVLAAGYFGASKWAIYLKTLTFFDPLRTDRPVVITQGTTVLTGEDFYANNATMMSTLARNSHIVIQAHKH